MPSTHSIRRNLLGHLAIVLIGLAFVPAARADVKIDEPTKKATAKALEWLAAKQNSDGSFSDGRYVHDTAMTSFALLAFMSQGHLPAQGKYGPEVNKAARFLMAAAKPNKVQIEGKPRDVVLLVGARGDDRDAMYRHGIATLALAELWGSTGDDEIKPVLEKAVQLIIGTQNQQGGWRYRPQPIDA